MPDTYNTGKCRLFHCAKCGYGVNDIYIENEQEHLLDNAPLFKFCPWCGRKVKEESE